MGPHHQGLVMQLSLDLVGRWMEEHAMEALMVGGGDEEERELTVRGLATYQPYDGILALKMCITPIPRYLTLSFIVHGARRVDCRVFVFSLRSPPLPTQGPNSYKPLTRCIGTRALAQQNIPTNPTHHPRAPTQPRSQPTTRSASAHATQHQLDPARRRRRRRRGRERPHESAAPSGKQDPAVAAAPAPEWHSQERRQRRRHGQGVALAAGVVVGGGGGRHPEAAPGAGGVRVRAARLHGGGVQHPHGPARRAGARPRVRGHSAPARRARRPPRAQLAPRRTQHGVRRDAGRVHPLGDPRRAAAAGGHRSADDVHLPRRARLLHAAAVARGFPELRDGLPRRQRLLLSVLLRARRGRGDRVRGHAARRPAQASLALRRAQPAAGDQAAGVEGALHHRLGRRRWRRAALRYGRRQVPGEQGGSATGCQLIRQALLHLPGCSSCISSLIGSSPSPTLPILPTHFCCICKDKSSFTSQ